MNEIKVNKEKPKYLYKYCPINEHTINMICSNEAYFSLPIKFNDPFDCNIVPEIIYTPEEHMKFVSVLKETNNFTQTEYRGLVENPKKFIGMEWNNIIEEIRKNIKVFCLSSVNDNILMYSHYAEKHRGICLEFLVTNDPFFDTLDYVRYKKMIPPFHAFNENKNLIQNELKEIEVLTKSCQWSYEEEWRILKNGSPIYIFSPEILSSIIFGCQTSSEDKIIIERAVEKRIPPIQLKEAIKKEKSFELEIKPYKS
jgi:Protein of unknown function (DUF2971)